MNIQLCCKFVGLGLFGAASVTNIFMLCKMAGCNHVSD